MLLVNSLLSYFYTVALLLISSAGEINRKWAKGFLYNIFIG